MPIRPVALRSPLVLVPGSRLPSQLLDLASREGFPHSPYDIADDLNGLNAVGGVPLLLSEPLPGKSDWSILLHTRGYLVRLFMRKKFGDAYDIASVAPMRLQDHQRLARGYLLMRPRDWRVANSPQEIPPGSASGWEALVAGWNQLMASLATTSRPTERQDAFLSVLGGVIDVTERITTASEGGTGHPYRAVQPTGGVRSGVAQAFEFTLAGGRVPDENAFVQVTARAADGPGIVRTRGQVTRAGGQTITIRLDEPVDWNDLRGGGEITTTSSTVSFRMQRDAVGQLRVGHARNPGILSAFIDGDARAPGDGQHASTKAPSPVFTLNPHQREAFDKAFARPDLLAVIGPPGTGKTTTITEMVRAAVDRGERVIVCSQNNRAIDNVLGRLPAELVAIRVGNEARVTPEGLPYLLQRQAAELRQRSLNQSRQKLRAYDRLGDAEGWAAELRRRNAALAAARRQEAQERAVLDSARRAAGGPATEEVDRLAQAQVACELAARRGSARAARLERLSEQAATRVMWLAIGWFFGLLARRWAEKSGAEQARVAVLGSALNAATARLAAAGRHLVEVTRDVPAVIAAKAAADAAGARAQREHATALQAAQSAIDLVKPTRIPLPPVTGSGDAELAVTQEWLAGWLPFLAARRDLLSQWIEEASGDSSQLHPELLRYAGVLTATCTGAGSRPELADLDFDLAIVDEAGQIGVADALVPLVRARRAVLVGDHMQLPPFLDSDVEAWGKLTNDPAVQATLKKSALEMVVEALPEGSPNVVWLTEQRRMPEVIAKFASTQFYQGRLETPPGLREHRDGLFRSPLAFIDTSALEWSRRRDRSGANKERFGQRGYDNLGEARMLANLAVEYDQANQDWGVIVPYLAQAELIRRLLVGHAGDADKVRLNVGTVDSFQGGERDVVLYGFTRSNPERRVGFLSELRRVNVAITRARMQLVLVGDLDTLTEARNRLFRELARSLRDYVAGCGEIVAHDSVRDRLSAEGMTRWTD